MKIMKRAAALALGVGVVAAGLAVPAPAHAASKCTGTSGYWNCYATTTGPAYATKVVDSFALVNNSNKAATFHCSVTKTVSFSSSFTVSATESVKAGLFGVAEGTISGTQSYTMTLTKTQATNLAFDVQIPAHQSRLCQVINGYYKVGTKWEKWNNYKVTDTKSGTTTVPYRWGLQLS